MIGIPRSTSNCSQKRVFHLFRPLISGKCSMHAASRGTTGHHRAHCQRSGAEHGDPGAHVSLFRRLVVPGTRSSTYATAEHLRIQYTGMSANSCHYLIHIRSILHVRQRSSIDEALLSEVPQPAGVVHHFAAHAIADIRQLAGVSQARKLISCSPKPEVDALSLEHENRPIQAILLSRLPCTFPRISLDSSHLSLCIRIHFDRSSATPLHLEIFFPISAPLID